MASSKNDKPVDVKATPELQRKETALGSGAMETTLRGIQGDESRPTITDKIFTFFPKLPTELRLIVWEMALPGERILESRFYYNPDKTLCWCLLPSERSPATLFACRESRTIGLKYYQPLTEEGIAKPWVQYFDPKFDTLFSTNSFGEVLFPTDGSCIDVSHLIAERTPTLAKLAVYCVKTPVTSRPTKDLECLTEVIVVYPRRSGTIDKVSSIKRFGKDNTDSPLSNFRKYIDGRFEPLFKKLEESISSWRAPEIKTGIFVEREE
jgi:hypothetical protein